MEKCLWCGEDLLKDSTHLTILLENGRPLFVRNLPCLKCQSCGEEVILPEDQEKLENQVLEAKKEGFKVGECSLLDFQSGL